MNSRIPSTASDVLADADSHDEKRSLPRQRHQLSDRPHEAQKLPGHGRRRDDRAFASRRQALVGLVQSNLGLPGNIDDLLRDLRPVLLHSLTDLRGRPVIPGSLAQNASCRRITGLRNAARSDRPSA